MVDDMRGQFTEINGHLLAAKRSGQSRTADASAVVGEIRFHYKIIECVVGLLETFAKFRWIHHFFPLPICAEPPTYAAHRRRPPFLPVAGVRRSNGDQSLCIAVKWHPQRARHDINV